MQVSCRDGLLLREFSVCIADDDTGKPFLQIPDAARQTENCHDLGRDRDVIAVLAGSPVHAAAQAVHNISQLAVIHIHAALPCDLSRVNVQAVSLENVIVDHRGKQVVGSADRVEIACEMQIDILHRHDLSVSAAGCTALDSEDRAERRLTERDDHVLPDLFHGIRKTDGRGRLALACRSRIDGCHKDKLAVRLLNIPENTVIDLCLILSVLFKVLIVNSRSLRDLRDRKHLCRLCNLNICLKFSHIVFPPL